MIKSFADKETSKLFANVRSRALRQELHRKARMKLLQLEAADGLDDLRVPPGNRLEKLQGDRKDLYSIRINNQWRICFNWESGEACNVEIVDYH